jgi:hypothetical protein
MPPVIILDDDGKPMSVLQSALPQSHWDNKRLGDLAIEAVLNTEEGGNCLDSFDWNRFMSQFPPGLQSASQWEFTPPDVIGLDATPQASQTENLSQVNEHLET